MQNLRLDLAIGFVAGLFDLGNLLVKHPQPFTQRLHHGLDRLLAFREILVRLRRMAGKPFCHLLQQCFGVLIERRPGERLELGFDIRALIGQLFQTGAVFGLGTGQLGLNLQPGGMFSVAADAQLGQISLQHGHPAGMGRRCGQIGTQLGRVL